MAKKFISVMMVIMFALSALTGAVSTAAAGDCSGCGCRTCCNDEYCEARDNPPTLDDITAAVAAGGEVTVPEDASCYQACFYQAVSMAVICFAAGGNLASCYVVAVGWYFTCIPPCQDQCLDEDC